MKRIIAFLLACVLALTACGQPASSNTAPAPSAESVSEETKDTAEQSPSSEAAHLEFRRIVPEFTGMNDPSLLRYTEDNVYAELVAQLNDENCFIENVSAVYVSKEYLQELAFNSQSNVFFGYSLEELDAAFYGTRYVFTLGDDGTTVVQAFKNYADADDTYEEAIRNVATGSGVILICVTVSVVTAGAGAPAVSMIFATAARTGTEYALASGVIGFAAAAIVTGIQTDDPEEAFKAGILSGSEEFKWGAITGVITGGTAAGAEYAKAMRAPKDVPPNGLSVQEAAATQMESRYPIDVVRQFNSVEEYNFYRDAGLRPEMINGKLALVRDIDLTFKSELPNGEVVTNLERMARGYAPLDPTGTAYQLHHIGQKMDATLAVLTEAEHLGNSALLNIPGKESEIDRAAFNTIRKAFWKSFAASVS